MLANLQAVNRLERQAACFVEDIEMAVKTAEPPLLIGPETQHDVLQQ